MDAEKKGLIEMNSKKNISPYKTKGEFCNKEENASDLSGWKRSDYSLAVETRNGSTLEDIRMYRNMKNGIAYVNADGYREFLDKKKFIKASVFYKGDKLYVVEEIKGV
jgi:thermostable 8-oxoguanine DNA glycosylase